VKPPFLRPGDPIAVVAPSGVVERGRLAAGIAYLRSHGHPVLTGPHVGARDGYFAGRDAVRAGDLNAAIADRRARAIFFARGGYGLTRILDRIDLRGLVRRPRLLLGFSDATALFMALQRRSPGLVQYGPLVSEMGDRREFDEESLWAALYGRREAFTIRFGSSDVLRPGTGRGRVLGGCLSLLVSLLGTRHDPDYRGAILFWEEIGEEPYRIDRMLTQLRNAGKLEHLQGMVVGSLTGCAAPAGKPSLHVRRILTDLAGRTRYPIVWNLRAGHTPGKLTLPLGIEATLSSRRRSLAYRLPV
jgi:muramoyltetrapeptide carboxypeptidase